MILRSCIRAGIWDGELMPVAKLMHTGNAIPIVAPDASLPEIVHEMSAKRLGMTTVQQSGRLFGVLSDGDLRRLLEREGPKAFGKTAAEVMNPLPHTIAPEPLAPDALEVMERHRITSLVVTADGTAASAVLGVLHTHDLWAVAGRGREELTDSGARYAAMRVGNDLVALAGGRDGAGAIEDHDFAA